MKNSKYPLNRFALKLALFSLCFGVLQVIIYAIYPNNISLRIGMIHLYPTVIIHSIVLLMVIISGIKNYKDLSEHFLVILAMLANIPIAIGCFYAILAL
ncbi:hypothetical protein [Dokdonia sp.]|uniref:hypothetical protein n=1 Tax=Dokdonia sp. TaxID=2024995 RepID=UPI003263463E